MRPMFSTTEPTYTMKLLDGTNYGTWKVQMEAALQAAGLYKFVTPRVSQLKIMLADDFEKLENLLENDEKALGCIKKNIEILHLDLIADCKTALEAWIKLEVFFAGKETFNKINLLQSLIDGPLKETGNIVRDIQEFVQSKNDLVQRLGSIGIKIDEELQVAIMLSRLPSCFDTMRRILESQENLTLIKLIAELHREGVRQSSVRAPKRSMEEIAMLSNQEFNTTKKQKFDKKKLFCKFCDVSGHDGDRCWLDPNSKGYRKNFAESLKSKTIDSRNK
jgi:hypothetical protein